MRSLLLAIPVLLSLAACSKAEEAAKEAAAAKLAEKVTGGAVKAGELCPDWPKNVPVYPGAKIVACITMNAPDGGAGMPDEMHALLEKREGHKIEQGPPTKGVLTLGLETSASADDVVAYYKKNMPADWPYMSTAGQAGMENANAWSNKAGTGPVYSVLMRQPTKSA
ncbi:MAG TPA: hypothetical protein VF407_04980, partial [Polyangiaceae bacterium]